MHGHPFHSALIRDKYQIKCIGANCYLFQGEKLRSLSCTVQIYFS